jgi:O-succinylhomoserine sulfhydrylase
MTRPPFNPKELDPQTLAIRGGSTRSEFGEHSEAMFMTSSFTFNSAAEAAARFGGQSDGPIYSRFTNPTVAMFERRLALLEATEACVATSSGMSAILAVCLGLLAAGDHIVSARSLFGATHQLFVNVLAKFGVSVSFVPQGDLAAWQAAMQPGTKLLYVEVPSNPLLEVANIAALRALADKSGALLAVDNCICSPVLQQPAKLGAHLVLHSATKFLDGQGRVIAGAICGAKQLLDEKIVPIMRSAGPSLSPFNAWLLLKGMETLAVRVHAQSAATLDLAQRLAAHKAVAHVIYPGLASHPQHALAMRQQSAGGAVLTFEVPGGRDAAWKLIDATRLWSITANFGDTRSIITHPASTTHGRLTPEARAAQGVTEGMIRLGVGLENVDDLWADLQRGLAEI